MDKKLCIVRAGKKVVNIIAAYKNEKLIIAEVNTHPVDHKTANNTLIKKIHSNSAKGYTVAIDEAFKYFSQGFIINSLAQLDANGKPKLVNALSAYNYLNQRKLIIFTANVRKINIPDSLVDKEVDDKGNDRYSIDWESIKDEEITLLLACYCALYNQSSEINYLRSVLGRVRILNARKPRTARGFVS